MTIFSVQELANVCVAAVELLPASALMAGLAECDRQPDRLKSHVADLLEALNDLQGDSPLPCPAAAIVAAMSRTADLQAAQTTVTALMEAAVAGIGRQGRFDRRLYALAALGGVLEAANSIARC